MRMTHQQLTEKFQKTIEGREDEFEGIYIEKIETGPYFLAERMSGGGYKQISNFYTVKEMDVYLNGLRKGLTHSA